MIPFDKKTRKHLVYVLVVLSITIIAMTAVHMSLFPRTADYSFSTPIEEEYELEEIEQRIERNDRFEVKYVSTPSTPEGFWVEQNWLEEEQLKIIDRENDEIHIYVALINNESKYRNDYHFRIYGWTDRIIRHVFDVDSVDRTEKTIQNSITHLIDELEINTTWGGFQRISLYNRKRYLNFAINFVYLPIIIVASTLLYDYGRGYKIKLGLKQNSINYEIHDTSNILFLIIVGISLIYPPIFLFLRAIIVYPWGYPQYFQELVKPLALIAVYIPLIVGIGLLIYAYKKHLKIRKKDERPIEGT